MRMTPEAFHTWSQRLQLSAETEALIAPIRSSPPVRRPSGRAGNITGRYPSPKMGVSIQFESDRVEFLARFGGARAWGRLRLRNLLVRFSKTQPVPASYPCGLSRAASIPSAKAQGFTRPRFA